MGRGYRQVSGTRRVPKPRPKPAAKSQLALSVKKRKLALRSVLWRLSKLLRKHAREVAVTPVADLQAYGDPDKKRCRKVKTLVNRLVRLREKAGNAS